MDILACEETDSLPEAEARPVTRAQEAEKLQRPSLPSPEERRPSGTQVSCGECRHFGHLAGPGTSLCSTRGPRSANLNAHFGIPLLHAALKMGERLKHFSPFWRDVLGCTPYALEAVEGFRPHFISPPPLSLPGTNFCTPSQGKNDIYINQEVERVWPSSTERR
jgi:hypothetical protein